MAVITIDERNSRVTILIEKRDQVRAVEDDTTIIRSASQYGTGSLLMSGSTNICMIRGERE